MPPSQMRAWVGIPGHQGWSPFKLLSGSWAESCTAAGQLLLSTKQQHQRQQGGAQALPWREIQQQQLEWGPQRQHVDGQAEDADDEQQELEDGEAAGLSQKCSGALVRSSTVSFQELY